MTRYIKPESGSLVKFSEEIMESGDGAWYPVVGVFATIGGLGAGVPLTVGVSPAFAALIIPALFFLVTLFSYVKGTISITGRSDSEYYSTAMYKYWPKLKGTELEGLAKPLIEQIYNCTVEGHPGAGYGKNCTLCNERKKTLKELIPNKPSNRSDIDAAKRFIDMKKESDKLVLEEYEKLMIEQ